MKRRKIIIWSVSIFLTALFVAGGLVTLVNGYVAASFAQYNLSGTVRHAVGLIEIAAGLALLVPAVAWQVAACLALAMAAAVMAQLLHGEQWFALVPGFLAGLLAAVGYLRHPRSSLLTRLRAAADAFADRELALEKGRARKGQ
jgi:hypothetical protein